MAYRNVHETGAVTQTPGIKKPHITAIAIQKPSPKISTEGAIATIASAIDQKNVPIEIDVFAPITSLSFPHTNALGIPTRMPISKIYSTYLAE